MLYERANCATKVKANFSFCGQIKFNEHVPKPVITEQQHIVNHPLVIKSSIWKTSCYP